MNLKLTLLLVVGMLALWLTTVGLIFMVSLVSRSIDMTTRGVERLLRRRRPRDGAQRRTRS